MAAVSAFGYSVPLVVILVAVALVVGLLIAVSFWLTIGLSVYRSVQDTRRQQVRGELQSELLDGVFGSDMDWSQWVSGLSGTERAVVESLLDEYLRELDGQDARKLQELGVVLGIPTRSKRWLEHGGEYKRLHGLTWLTLLEQSEQLADADFTPQTPRERAAVVRLWYDCGTLEQPKDGLAVLLEDASSQFSVFGQDTLYEIAAEDPSALFEIAETSYKTWSEPLLVQVLAVCQHLGTSVTTDDLSWLTATLEHESTTVRAATARALGTFGWRQDIRDKPFLARLARDPSPEVRSAVYRMLAEWGDSDALGALKDRLENEDDQRARLVGTNALAKQGETVRDDVPHQLAATMSWSAEHAQFDDIARLDKQIVGD